MDGGGYGLTQVSICTEYTEIQPRAEEGSRSLNTTFTEGKRISMKILDNCKGRAEGTSGIWEVTRKTQGERGE